MTEEIKLTFKKPASLTADMKESLAHCYAMPGFRNYLTNMVNSLVVLSAMTAQDMNELSEYRGALKYINKILSQSKSCFYDYEKIKEMEKRIKK